MGFWRLLALPVPSPPAVRGCSYSPTRYLSFLEEACCSPWLTVNACGSLSFSLTQRDTVYLPFRLGILTWIVHEQAPGFHNPLKICIKYYIKVLFLRGEYTAFYQILKKLSVAQNMSRTLLLITKVYLLTNPAVRKS